MVPDTYADLFWSYTAVWSVVAVYVGILGYRVSSLERLLSRKERERSNHESSAVCSSER
jgi:hypothetical protein